MPELLQTVLTSTVTGFVVGFLYVRVLAPRIPFLRARIPRSSWADLPPGAYWIQDLNEFGTYPGLDPVEPGAVIVHSCGKWSVKSPSLGFAAYVAEAHRKDCH